MKNKKAVGSKLARGVKDLASEEKSKKKKLGPKMDITLAPSMVFEDGRIAEMIQDSETKETMFALYENNKVELVPQIRLNELVDFDGQSTISVLRPFPSDHALLRMKSIKLPSEAKEYESNLQLFEEVKALLRKYFTISENFAVVASVYVMLTWLFDQFNTLPYLRVIGTLGTGKSRFLTIVGNLSYRGMIVSGSVSMPSLFRTIDEVGGTFLLDEADYKNSDMWSEKIKVLNAGHSKDFPVMRMTKNFAGDFETETFNVYGPKILGSRERFADQALESRCISQYLLPLKKQFALVHLPKEFASEAIQIRNKLLMFRFRNFEKAVVDESTVEKVDFPRLKQTALALTSVAKIIDESVLTQLLNYLVAYEKNLEKSDVTDTKADVLLCILECLEDEEIFDSKKLKIGYIAEKFNRKFYGDYADKETRQYESRETGPLSIPAYVVSPKRIGGLVKKLNISVRHEGIGYIIPVAEEYEKIRALAQRYGFDQFRDIPEKYSDIKPTKVVLEKIGFEDEVEEVSSQS